MLYEKLIQSILLSGLSPDFLFLRVLCDSVVKKEAE
jgi:hypothetical protein